MTNYTKYIDKLPEKEKTKLLNKIANLSLNNVHNGQKIDDKEKVRLIQEAVGVFAREGIFK